MLDHISLRVVDYDKAVAFYKAALAPIGYSVLMEFPGYAGLGDKKPDFWITRTDKPTNPTHIAFATDRKLVDAFHAAAVAAGGTDDGPPGLRSQYHPNYYGAFVIDPEGNHVEAVCHEASGVIAMATATAAGAKAKAKKAVAKARGKVQAVAKKAAGRAKSAAGKAKAAAGKAGAKAKKAVASAKAKAKPKKK